MAVVAANVFCVHAYMYNVCVCVCVSSFFCRRLRVVCVCMIQCLCFNSVSIFSIGLSKAEQERSVECIKAKRG